MTKITLKAPGIYTITNTRDGAQYVGSAKNLKVRASRHASALSLGKHHNRHLQAAYKKHGRESFSFAPLLVCSEEDLLFFEQRAIDVLDPKYNHAKIAGNTLGVSCSPERKAKISAAHKGKTLTKEHREAIAAGGRGRKPSEETREKLKRASQRRAANPEWRRKVAAGKTGTPLSEAHRRSMSLARKGKPANLPEASRLEKNRKIGEANRVRPISQAFRDNMSKAQKERPDIERYSYKGGSYTLMGLTEVSGISKPGLRHRILKLGWSVEKAVETPSKKTGTPARGGHEQH